MTTFDFNFDLYQAFKQHEAEFKEFEPRPKFETRLKYGCLHLKLFHVSRFKPALN